MVVVDYNVPMLMMECICDGSWDTLTLQHTYTHAYNMQGQLVGEKIMSVPVVSAHATSCDNCEWSYDHLILLHFSKNRISRVRGLLNK